MSNPGPSALAAITAVPDDAAMGEISRAGGTADLTRLDRDECLRLLAGVHVGRLIFTMNALPAVRPMNFALTDGLILLRTAADSTVARKVDGQVVVFQADEFDAGSSSGWSVTVTGRAAVVTDPAAIGRYHAVPLVPWAPGQRELFVTVGIELAEGLRIHGPATAESDSRG
jgi:uncharacterized protein